MVNKIKKKYVDELTIKKPNMTRRKKNWLTLDKNGVGLTELRGMVRNFNWAHLTRQKKDFLRCVLDMIVVKSKYGYGRYKIKKIQRGHTRDLHYK